MTTGREANVNSLRPSVCNFSEFPCPSNRGRFNLRLSLATVNQQLHCLALELLVVSFLNLPFLHGFSLFTLSFRVRKIRGGSEYQAALVGASMLDLKFTFKDRREPVAFERIGFQKGHSFMSKQLEPWPTYYRRSRLSE